MEYYTHAQWQTNLYGSKYYSHVVAENHAQVEHQLDGTRAVVSRNENQMT